MDLGSREVWMMEIVSQANEPVIVSHAGCLLFMPVCDFTNIG